MVILNARLGSAPRFNHIRTPISAHFNPNPGPFQGEAYRARWEEGREVLWGYAASSMRRACPRLEPLDRLFGRAYHRDGPSFTVRAGHLPYMVIINE